MKLTRRTTTRRTPPALDAVKSRLQAPEWDRRRAQAERCTLSSNEGQEGQGAELKPGENRFEPAKAQADGKTLGTTEGQEGQRSDRTGHGPVRPRHARAQAESKGICSPDPLVEQRAEPCPKCGATSITLEPCPTGPHFAARRCRKCHKFRGWQPHPVSYPDACAYRLPFGRHKGRSLEEIDAADAGVQYLLWALSIDALDCKSRRHILRYLKGPKP